MRTVARQEDFKVIYMYKNLSPISDEFKIAISNKFFSTKLNFDFIDTV